jgi:hypothetical protein
VHGDHQDDAEEERGAHGPEVEAPVVERLGQQVAEGRAEGAGEHEGEPEEQEARRPAEAVQQGERDEEPGDQGCALREADAEIVGEQVSRGGSQGVGDQEGEPVVQLCARAGDGLHADRALHPVPERQHGEQAGDQEGGAPQVAEAEGAVEEVGNPGAGDGRRREDGPVGHRVVALQQELHAEQQHEQAQEDLDGPRVAEVERHREHVRAGLAQRGGGDLDDPVEQEDVRDAVPEETGGRTTPR